MATAGSIIVDLLMRTGSFFTDTGRAEKALKDLDRTASKIGRSVAGNIAGLAAGFVSLQAGIRFFSDAINQADRLDELSARLSISTVKLSEWSYAAKMSGTDIESLTGSLTKFSKNVTSALDSGSASGKLFKQLGIDVLDSEKRLRSVDSLLPEVADKFKTLDNTTLETALAMELFGKSGAEMLEFLNRGSSGLDELAAKARALGIVIQPEQAEAAAKFKDELDNLTAAGQGYATQVSAHLLPQMTELTARLSAFVSDGQNAVDTANALDNSFTVLGGTAKFLGTFLDGIGNVVEGLTEGMYGLGVAAKGALSFDLTKFKDGIRVAQEGADLAYYGQDAVGPRGAPVPKATPKINFAGRGDAPANFFGRSEAEVKARADAVAAEKRLADFLARGSGSGKGSSGPSDAEKAAERLAKATREMTKAQREWQTELDGTGNEVADAYAQRLDEITSRTEKFAADGLPTAKIEEFKAAMTGLAESLKTKELAKFQDDFRTQTLELAASFDSSLSPAVIRYNKELAELNEVIKTGLLSQEDIDARLAAMQGVRSDEASRMRKDYEFEIELLGTTREQQEQLNAARRLGADAATEQGEAALAALRDLQFQRAVMEDQISAMDGLRDSTRGFLHDLKEGEGVWDSLTKAADRFADVLFDLVANNIVEQLFGQTGSASGGSAGGGLSSLFGNFFSGGKSGGSGGWLDSLFGGGGGSSGGWLSSLFGGGKGAAPSSGFASLFGSNTGWLFGGGLAAGGQTMSDRAYLVGENGPEMFVPRAAGRVLPTEVTQGMLGGGRGDFNNNVTQVFHGPQNRRTIAQAAAEQGREARRAMARNGA